MTGVRIWPARLGTWARAGRLAFRRYPPRRAAAVLHALLAQVARRRGFPLPRKRVRAGGRTYFDLTVPGWPSRALDRFLEGELERIALAGSGSPPLQMAVFAVTRRCPLRCQHCSEWDLLGAEESLALGQVVEIARSLAARGAVHLELSGGEPMARLDAVEAVCRALGREVDAWVLTSGTGLDIRTARRLREAGAIGAVVSLDHWDPARHDAFRGAAGCFERAVEGARAAGSEGLAVALSLTATRAFTSADDLSRYTRLARDLGAGFIRILEPRAVGRWTGRDVTLGAAQLELLERFARTENAVPSDLPIVDFPPVGQRAVGCWGAGDRYLFVDAEGFAHACPFCRGRAGTCLDGGLPSAVARLRQRGCHAFACATPGPRGSGP